MSEDWKVTFGFYLNTEDHGSSHVVFHGRDKNLTIQISEFSRIWISQCKNGGYPVVHAKGLITLNLTDVYRFHFKATDKGAGELDATWLRLMPDHHHEGGDDGHDDRCTECAGAHDEMAGAETPVDHEGCGCTDQGNTSDGEHEGGGCSGGHSGQVRWITHGLGGGNIWVVPES